MRLRKSERQKQILIELRHHPHVRTSDLAARFGVSTETLRRDMEALSAEGLLRRAYGGAAALSLNAQPSFGVRSRARIEERRRIAECAAGLVASGQVVMIDAGSTTYQLALSLAAMGAELTVLTNSLAVASALGRNEAARVVLCPGDLMAAEEGVYGPETTEFLGRFNVDLAFIGASGVDPNGISDANMAAVAVKRSMIRQARATYLLADSSKFGVEAVAKVGTLSAIAGVVTDRRPQHALVEAIEAVGAALLISDADMSVSPEM